VGVAVAVAVTVAVGVGVIVGVEVAVGVGVVVGVEGTTARVAPTPSSSWARLSTSHARSSRLRSGWRKSPRTPRSYPPSPAAICAR